MPENGDSAGIIEELTPEEQKALLRALRRIEADLFNRVLRRISIFFGVVLSILLIGGLMNLSSCSSNIEATTAQKLSSDPELRDRIINKAQGDFKDTQERLKALNTQIAELEKDNASAVATFGNDLEEIHFMVVRINDELTKRLRSPGNSQIRPPEKRDNE